jgi:hypothetical protein
MGRTADAPAWAGRGEWPYAGRPDGDHRDPRAIRERSASDPRAKEIIMILATTTVEDVDRFLKVFGTTGADKRAVHGSKGATVFRDPAEDNRMWVLFEWDEQGWASFVSDPEVPPILKEAGHLGKPQTASLLGQYRA